MAAKYDIGQKVIIKPPSNRLSPRDSALRRYLGQSGEVMNYYWISLGRGANAFYIYTVRVEDDQKEVVLHEDELEAYKP
jgi:ribosomal protein L21E